MHEASLKERKASQRRASRWHSHTVGRILEGLETREAEERGILEALARSNA
jgi:hypothetical protein